MGGTGVGGGGSCLLMTSTTQAQGRRDQRGDEQHSRQHGDHHARRQTDLASTDPRLLAGLGQRLLHAATASLRGIVMARHVCIGCTQQLHEVLIAAANCREAYL